MHARRTLQFEDNKLITGSRDKLMKVWVNDLRSFFSSLLGPRCSLLVLGPGDPGQRDDARRTHWRRPIHAFQRGYRGFVFLVSAAYLISWLMHA